MKIKLLISLCLFFCLASIAPAQGAKRQGKKSSRSAQQAKRKKKAQPKYRTPVKAKRQAPSSVNSAGESPAREKIDSSFKSPYVERGLPNDALQTVFMDPELVETMRTNRQLWLGNILRIGLYIRPRAELRGNLNFSQSNPENINRFTQNSQVFFFMNPSKDAELKITFQDSRVWGGEPGAKAGDDAARFYSGGDNSTACPTNGTLCNSPTSVAGGAFAVREAYLNFRNFGFQGFGVQVGRQVLAYGDQRMLGGANWNVSGLSFDGIRLKFDSPRFSSHIFGIKSTTSTTNNGINGTVSRTQAQGDSYLAGVYNTLRSEAAWLELYGIGLFRSVAVDCVGQSAGICGAANASTAIVSTSTTLQQANLYTVGVRLTNRTDNNKLPASRRWDYTVEVAFQAGNASDVIYAYEQDLSRQTARMYTGKIFFAQTGYKILDDWRIGIQAYYSPGTVDRTGSALNTFQSLPGPRMGTFPYPNNFNGISENLGIKNIFTPRVCSNYGTDKIGHFIFCYGYEMKATPEDAWYAASGIANSASSSTTPGRISTENASHSANRELGTLLFQEVDLVWMQQFSGNFSLWVGVGYLRAGGAIGIARGADFQPDGIMSFFQLTGVL